MPIPNSDFDYLQTLPTDVPSPEPKTNEPDMRASTPATRPTTGEELWNNFKLGLASGPEVTNAAVRFLLPFDAVKKTFPPGGATKALGVDQKKLRGAGTITDMVAPFAEGVGMTPYAFVPGLGEEEAGTSMMSSLSRLATKAAKNAMFAGGSNEISTAGGDVGSGVGKFFAGEAGGEVGGVLGSIGGGILGGWGNVARYNAVGKSAITAAKYGPKAVTALPGAYRAARAAQAAGEEQNIAKVFLAKHADITRGGLGLLQKKTSSNLARILSKDPRTVPAIEEFRDAVGLLKPGEERLFSLAQMTDNPALYQLEQSRSTMSRDELAATTVKAANRKSALVNAYNRLSGKGLPSDQKTFLASSEAHRLETADQVSAAVNHEADVRNSITNLSGNEKRDLGNGLLEQWHNEKQAAAGYFGQEYEKAYAADTAGVDIGHAMPQIKRVLDSFGADIESGTAPKSIQALKDYVDKQTKEAKSFGFGEGSPQPPVRESLKDTHSVMSMLGSEGAAATRAYESTGNTIYRTRAENIAEARAALNSAVNETAAPAAAQQFAKTQADYATHFVPRFKEGVQSGFDTEVNAAGQRGRPRIPAEQVADKFLDPTKLPTEMSEFNRLFGGGNGIPRNQQAYALLGKALEDKFSKTVLNAGFSPDKAAAFMSKYDAALEQFPALGHKLTDAARELDMSKAHRELLQDTYKELVGSPLTASIGAMQVEKLASDALANSDKMSKLLASPLANTPDKAKSLVKELMLYANPAKPRGAFDYEGVSKLLDAAHSRLDHPSTLRMLFTKAFGEKAGDQQLQDMSALSELMRRDALSHPDMLHIAQQAADSSPMREASGQTVAQWLTGVRSMGLGYGKRYFPLVASGRFVNTKVQAIIDRSIQKAMYDPSEMRHVLELAQTPSNQAIPFRLLDHFFGKSTEVGRSVRKEILEEGLIKELVSKGGAIGATRFIIDQQQPKKKPIPVQQTEDYKALLE